MPAPSTHRTTVSTALLAALFGSLLGLATFALSAALWRTGQTHLAQMTAQGSLLLSLTCVAGFLVIAQPPRRRGVRVVADRRRPSARRIPEADPVPVLAICAGTPLLTGALAAALLFH
jgi:hypothetical protein